MIQEMTPTVKELGYAPVCSALPPETNTPKQMKKKKRKKRSEPKEGEYHFFRYNTREFQLKKKKGFPCSPRQQYALHTSIVRHTFFLPMLLFFLFSCGCGVAAHQRVRYNQLCI